MPPFLFSQTNPAYPGAYPHREGCVGVVLLTMKEPSSMTTTVFSVRTSPEIRARLQEAATKAGMALGPYMVWMSLNQSSPPPKAKRRVVVEDQQALAKLLGQLGASRIASNLNQLAKSANSGSLLDDPDTIARLNEALDEVSYMRRTLIEALGLDGSQ